jgi:hypothetical protein
MPLACLVDNLAAQLALRSAVSLGRGGGARVKSLLVAETVASRVEDWQKEAEFATPEKFIEFMQSFQPQLQ